MGFWTSSRSFSLRKISLDQKLEIFMSTFSSKKTKWIQQPPTSKVVEWNNSRDPPRIIEKFHEMITEELFNIIWQHGSDNDLSFIQLFPKKFFLSVWSQQHFSTLEFQVLALHKSCYDVIAWYICNAKVSHTYLSVTIHWYLLKEWLF